MDYMLDPPDEVTCRDCGEVIPTISAKRVAGTGDKEYVCRPCFETYNTEL